jgi:LysM repeat protein
VALITRRPPTAAAVVQITPTPLPTPTVTPTATPIVYTIVSGDTLLAIAIERQTTVDEIVALNPGVRPQALQIGQQLILPPPATAVFQGAGATAIPLQVEVIDVSLYRTPLEGMWIVGEVWNRGPYPAENLQVAIDIQAGDSAGPATALAWVEPAVLLPDERGPFAALLAQAPAEAGHPSVAIVGGNTLLEPGTRYRDLAVSESAVTIRENLVAVSGALENLGETAAGQIALIATFYDEQGRVAGYFRHRLSGVIAAGETMVFDFETSPPGGRVVDYRLLVEGQRAGEE